MTNPAVSYNACRPDNLPESAAHLRKQIQAALAGDFEAVSELADTIRFCAEKAADEFHEAHENDSKTVVTSRDLVLAMADAMAGVLELHAPRK